MNIPCAFTGEGSLSVSDLVDSLSDSMEIGSVIVVRFSLCIFETLSWKKSLHFTAAGLATSYSKLRQCDSESYDKSPAESCRGVYISSVAINTPASLLKRSAGVLIEAFSTNRCFRFTANPNVINNQET